MNLRTLALATAIVFAPATAFAQEQLPPNVETKPSSEYDDAQVGAFADAVGAVAEIDGQWRPRIEAAESAEEAESLAAESQTEMMTAIESSGITLDDYNEIYLSAQADPALAERINVALRDRFEARP